MALALCLTLLPATALAADSNHTASEHANPTKFTKLWIDTENGNRLMKGNNKWDVSAVKLWKPSDDPVQAYVLENGAYYLDSDFNFTDNASITDSECAIAITGDVTLCLNDHSITCAGKQSVISVYAIGCQSLTLTDCKGNGKITGGSVAAVDVRNGKMFNMHGGTLVGSSKGYGVFLNGSTGVTTTFNMYGGTIGGEINGNTGIGVKLEGASDAPTTFTMSGGTISHNKGGVSTGGGTFTMTGGTISKNTASNGGGVNIGNGGKFEMSGTAKISGNTAAYSGGGVYVSGGTFIMNGGEIKSNTAEMNGGGVYVTKAASSSNSAFTMNGGEIKSNTANTAGGGVFVQNGTFTVSGTPIVSENTSGSEENKVTDNVCLDANKTITIDSGLTTGTDIGVTTASAKVPAEDSTVAIATATGNANGYLSYFKSDNDSYEIVTNSQKTQLELKAKPKIPLTEDNTTIEITNKDTLVYSGKEITPTVVVTYTGSDSSKTLNPGTDYTVTSGGSGTDAKKYTLTIEGAGDYTGEVQQEWTIKPLTVKVGSVTLRDKEYDGTCNGSSDDVASVKFQRGSLDSDIVALQSEDYKIKSVTYADANASTNAQNVEVEVTLQNSNYTFGGTGSNKLTAQVDAQGKIAKASANDLKAKTGEINVVNNKADSYTLDLSTLLPTPSKGNLGNIENYTLGTVNLADGYYDSSDPATINGSTLTLPIKAVEVGKEDSIGTVTVKVTTQNYENFTLTINVIAVAAPLKDPKYTPPTAKSDLVYNGQEQALITAGTVPEGCKMLYKVGTGEWTDTVPTGKNADNYVVSYKVVGNKQYANVDPMTLPSVAIAQKKVTIRPQSFTITKGDALPEFKLEFVGLVNGETLTPSVKPTFRCLKVLTSVEEVTDSSVPGKYPIKWTNSDDIVFNDGTNYELSKETIGYLTVQAQSSGTGGGGGSSSGSTVKTDTVTNPDGSVTKTETKSDGTVVATTTAKDGSVTKTTTKKDGSSVTESKNANGSTGTVKTDKNGQTEAKTALSNKAVEDAKRNGEAVKAPVEVEATRNSGTAPTVKIELPRNSGETEVEIPVSNVKPGTVAVLVHADGTEEIVKNSLPTADGIQLTVNGSATVKIIDNSKDFIDTRNHWAKDAIDFVSARGLVSGMSATRYAPDATATRAQLWTILARQNDADLNGGNTWYEKAQLWSKDKGISDGTQPDTAISRAQMVTMLWRTKGQPAAASGASFADVPADSYYAQAVAWAVESGITAGVGGGRFDPAATCTRAQIATFLYRTYQGK